MNRIMHMFLQSMGVARNVGFNDHVCTNKCRFWTHPETPEYSVCLTSHKIHKCDGHCLVEDGETSVCTLTSNVICVSKEIYHTSINEDGKHESTINTTSTYTPKNNSSVENIMSIINQFFSYCGVEPMHPGVLKSVAGTISKYLDNSSSNYATIKSKTLSLLMLLIQGLTCASTGSVIVEKNTNICTPKDADVLWEEFPYEKVYNKMLLSLYDVYDDGIDMTVVPATSARITSS